MSEHPSSERRRLLLAGISALAIVASLLVALAVPVAAQSDPEQRAMESYWKNRYRSLLVDATRLREVIAREQELYADANRRNYRRGKKRHIHREAALEARAELQEVEQQLATIKDDARRAGALPGWLNEVEIEMEDEARRSGVASGPDEDGGRNPLYLEEDSN